jgi:hypothetical protein
MTTAGWLRKYVREHPDYKHDSVVSEKINYDICKIYAYVGAGYDVIPELTGMHGSGLPGTRATHAALLFRAVAGPRRRTPLPCNRRETILTPAAGDYLKPRPVMNENSADADCGGC